MAELNKRKEKEKEEKKIIEELRERVGELAKEEREWIDKNLSLKIEIKKIQMGEKNSEQSKEVEELKAKVAELKKH